MQMAWLIPSLLFGVYLGATTGQWQMIVMSAATAAIWLLARRFGWGGQVDFSQPISVTESAVFVGQAKLPRLSIFWKREWHDKIFEHLNSQDDQLGLVDRWQFELTRATTATGQAQFFLGLTSGKPLTLDLVADSPHALVVGSTGSGKSLLLKQMLNSVLKNPRDQCDYLLVDFKGGAGLAQFMEHPRVKALLTDIDGHDTEKAWLAVSQELDARERMLAAHGCSRIEELQQQFVALPRLVIVVDELASLFASSQAANAAIAAVLARGRSLGIHFLAASQSVQGLTRAMLTNLRARIILGEADPIDQAQLGIKKLVSAADLPPGWLFGQITSAAHVNSAFQFAPSGPDFK
ncbi:FtsK/SpoIIIE domain-containing protein [Rhodoluna sp.]|uniref:FtsK/SpoIIIE domain-containing protein n=1 Tax=Rhodoluna sp. TaxID=1969481 RepID=UPI0025FB823B|nr:FtsK/SpoIIIE domain-containing protein [Rhodoluna sp.]